MIVAVVRFPLDPPLLWRAGPEARYGHARGRHGAAFAGARIASFRGEHPVREAAPAGASPPGHKNDRDRIEVS